MGRIPDRIEMHDALAAKHGESLQARLDAARVAVCGLGGLGSNIAIALARAGVGRLHLMDFDRVEITNLNRQQYKVSQIGLPKTEAMRENLAEIAPYCDVTIDTVRLTAENIPEKLSGFPIICEAFDKAEAKATLLDAVTQCFPDAWLVSGTGMAGIGSANLIRTRRLGRRLVLCGDGVSGVEDSGALIGARVLVCAAHQAMAIIRIIADAQE
ncbi:MAG: sulfur carrier protein ThiS adenylyltransferase ThiF [Victivallales bacterium]|nr:sulfur carrier protein ThiS adenylyltransferase ThiF [Victivallales bacterium]